MGSGDVQFIFSGFLSMGFPLAVVVGGSDFILSDSKGNMSKWKEILYQEVDVVLVYAVDVFFTLLVVQASHGGHCHFVGFFLVASLGVFKEGEYLQDSHHFGEEDFILVVDFSFSCYVGEVGDFSQGLEGRYSCWSEALSLSLLFDDACCRPRALQILAVSQNAYFLAAACRNSVKQRKRKSIDGII